MIFGVRSTRAAVMFNFASSFCYVIAHSYVAIHGFTKGARCERWTLSSLKPHSLEICRTSRNY